MLRSCLFAGKTPQRDEAVTRDLEELAREMSALAETFTRAAEVARAGIVKPARQTNTTVVSKLIVGMDLRELGEEVELLGFGGGHEANLIV